MLSATRIGLPRRLARNGGRLLSILSLLCLTLGPVAAVSREAKTLQRSHDALVLSFEGLPVGAGKSASRFRLYRFASGEWEAIPYQIDSRDGEGEYAAASVTSPVDFVVDADDELVFMARDTGHRATKPALAPSLEIEVRDPRTDERGWVYLFDFEGDPPPRSPRSYVEYDAERDVVKAESYEISYEPKRNFFSSMRIPAESGGNGKNFLQRMSMLGRPTFSFLKMVWSFDITEDTTQSHVVAVTSGPVRVIRRTRLSVDLGRFLPTLPNGHIYTTHYPSHSVAPMNLSIPGIILKRLRSFEFESVSDFNTRPADTKYWDEAHPEGFDFRNGDSLVTKNDHEWWAVGGPAGTYLQLLFIPDLWKDWGIARGAVVRGGEDRRPSAGYSLLNMANIREGGTYRMQSAMVILPRPYEPGDEKAPVAIFHEPLETTVRPFREYRLLIRSASIEHERGAVR